MLYNTAMSGGENEKARLGNDLDANAARVGAIEQIIENGMGTLSLLDEYLRVRLQIALQDQQSLADPDHDDDDSLYSLLFSGYQPTMHVYPQTLQPWIDKLTKVISGTYHGEKAEFCRDQAVSCRLVYRQQLSLGEIEQASHAYRCAQGWEYLTNLCAECT